MSGAQYKKNGLLIPSEWLKKMGDDINVQRSGAVVIIESKQRLVARKQLAKYMRDLRRAAREVGPLEDKDVSALVDEVRQARAGYL
jgi:RecB family endonuclease NucS